MDAKTFEVLLDRMGTDFTAWPSDAAGEAKKLLVHSQEARLSYEALRRVEAMIGSSRPRVAGLSAHRVVRRALAEIARREANPALLLRLLNFLLAPVPRAALAVTVTGIGFAVGIAIGNPTTDGTSYSNGSLMITASADDVLF